MESKTGLEMLALVSKALGIPDVMLFNETPGFMEVACGLDGNDEPRLTIYFESGKKRTIKRCSTGFEISVTSREDDTCESEE